MVKLCVFDLDGTLVNSLADLADSANSALKKNGFGTYETDRYRRFVGDGVPMLIKRALGENYSQEAAAAVLKDFNACYSLHYADKTRPYGGCPEMLMELAARGIKCAVLSNKPDDFVKSIIKRLYAGFDFDWIQGKSPEFPRKPDPAALLHIIGELGIHRDEVLYIGDSNVDIFTGHNAGVRAAGVLWGFRDREELEEAGADHIIGHPTQILELALANEVPQN